MKAPAIALAVLLFVPAAQAEPIRHKKAKAIAVLLITAAVTAWELKASHDCRRRAGVEHCLGGYGPGKAMAGLIVGAQATGATMAAWGLREDNRGWWIAPAASNSIFGINAIKQGQQRADLEAAHVSATNYRMRP